MVLKLPPGVLLVACSTPAILTPGAETLPPAARARTLQQSRNGKQAKGVPSWKLPLVAWNMWQVKRQQCSFWAPQVIKCYVNGRMFLFPP